MARGEGGGLNVFVFIFSYNSFLFFFFFCFCSFSIIHPLLDGEEKSLIWVMCRTGWINFLVMVGRRRLYLY